MEVICNLVIMPSIILPWQLINWLGLVKPTLQSFFVTACAPAMFVDADVDVDVDAVRKENHLIISLCNWK